MNKLQKMIILAAAVVLLIMAAGAHPQLSLDEQEAIIEAVVQTLNPENMKATVIAEVEADLIAKFNAAGFVGVAGALSQPLPAATEEPQPVPTEEPKPAPTEEPQSAETEDPLISRTADDTTETFGAWIVSDTLTRGERTVDDIHDFPEGAVLQPDGTYRGLHAKQVNSYAYTIGEDENGVVKQFHTEYTPNVRFNLDVVFENDGSVIWPARIKMCHIGTVGEYTGHAPCVEIDRTYDPVKPGDRAGFTVSAYGSENLGWTTFYFQLYDAVSGSPIEGGYGSFTYHAI